MTSTSVVTRKRGRPCLNPTHDRQGMINCLKEIAGVPDYKEIAQRFGCTPVTVRSVYRQIMNPQARKCSLRVIKRVSFREAIIQFARDNLTASTLDISLRFRVSRKYVQALLSRHGLGAGQGRCRGGHLKSSSSLGDENSPRYKTITLALREFWTLEELGQKLGVTRERARQLINKYKAIYEAVPTEYVSIAEVARILHVSPFRLKRYAVEHKIGDFRGIGGYRIPISSIEPIKNAFRASETRECRNCSAVFTANHSRHRYCSDGCREEYWKKHSYRSRGPVTDTKILRRWWKVADILRKRGPVETAYVPLAKAERIASASKMQLTYLRQRGIIRCRPVTNGRHRNGKPFMELALADILVVGDFLHQLK